MAVKQRKKGEWVRQFHPSSENAIRLVVFPHAGGSASYYYPMSQALTPDIEVLALQYPGRQDRRSEPCIENIPDLADGVYDALLPRLTAPGPYLFFGHSMGSIVAFEVARRCQQRLGGGPAHLIASGYPAPSRIPAGTVHLRDDAGVVRELREVGGTDPAWLDDADLLAAIMPTVRGDYRAIETHTYRPGPPLDCPITMLVGDQDPHTDAAQADAWREHTAAAFAQRVFPGGHFYLEEHQEEVVEMISGIIRNSLRFVSTDGSHS